VYGKEMYITGVIFYTTRGCTFLAFLYIKAKTKSLGIILTLWAMFVLISTFLLYLVSEVACGEECALFCHFCGAFLQFFGQFCHN